MVKINPVHLIPNKESIDQEWVNWHDACKKRYGRKTANILFIHAWQRRSEQGNWLVTGKANTTFLRSYLSDNGIEIDKGLADYPATILDNVEDVFQTAFNVGKYTGYTILAIIVLIIAGVVYTAIKNPKLLQDAGMAYATRGQSLKQ